MTDNRMLEPMLCGAGVVGFIPEVHGDGGKSDRIEVTRFEVSLLVEHWIQELKGVAFESGDGQTSSSGTRVRCYAERRIASFIEAGVISAEEVNAMAKDAFGDYFYEEYWPVWKEFKDWAPEQPGAETGNPEPLVRNRIRQALKKALQIDAQQNGFTCAGWVEDNPEGELAVRVNISAGVSPEYALWALGKIIKGLKEYITCNTEEIFLRDYFGSWKEHPVGTCPHCGKDPAVLRKEEGIWACCHEHRTKWGLKEDNPHLSKVLPADGSEEPTQQADIAQYVEIEWFEAIMPAHTFVRLKDPELLPSFE